MSVIVQSLSKIYGKQKALDQVSFEAQEGQIVGFLGPNGAGKSTTMKIATGYIPPSSGTIKICGHDVTKESMEVRKLIGYLPEHNPLYLDMYVKEYLAFIGKLHGLRSKKLKSNIREMVELCGLQREQHKKIGALSKGYRQRVGLAQSLIHDPKVLILDEPTTGLDPNQIVEIREVIRQASKNKTIIFSTHIMQEVQALCDKAIIINLGKIVADKSVDELKNLQQDGKTLVVEFSESINIDLIKALDMVNDVLKIDEKKYQIQSKGQADIRSAIFKLTSEQGWELLGLQVEEQTLESIFQQLTQ